MSAGDLKLILPIRSHLRRFGIHFRAEVTQRDERFGVARVLERHAGFRAVFGAEIFVLGQFVEADGFT